MAAAKQKEVDPHGLVSGCLGLFVQGQLTEAYMCALTGAAVHAAAVVASLALRMRLHAAAVLRPWE
eukprot:358539-Chlamydomonas_euryale.AAC.3